MVDILELERSCVSISRTRTVLLLITAADHYIVRSYFSIQITNSRVDNIANTSFLGISLGLARIILCCGGLVGGGSGSGIGCCDGEGGLCVGCPSDELLSLPTEEPLILLM